MTSSIAERFVQASGLALLASSCSLANKMEAGTVLPSPRAEATTLALVADAHR